MPNWVKSGLLATLAGVLGGFAVFLVATFFAARSNEAAIREFAMGEGAGVEWAMTIGGMFGLVAFLILFLWVILRRRSK